MSKGTKKGLEVLKKIVKRGSAEEVGVEAYDKFTEVLSKTGSATLPFTPHGIKLASSMVGMDEESATVAALVIGGIKIGMYKGEYHA